MNKINVLLLNGRGYADKKFDIEDIFYILKKNQEYLHNLKINYLIEFFEKWVNFLEKSNTSDKIPYLTNLKNFFSKEELTNSLKIAFRGNYLVLDNFSDLHDKKYLFRAQPRGVVVHWLAGNAPILGVFSILMAMITKNVSVAKVSSKGYKDLVYLLMLLKKINTPHVKGAGLLKTIVLTKVESKNKKVHQALSDLADVRIAWGGKEAIKSIISLKKKVFCEDIIFGPKYSLSLIDKENLEKNFKKTARSLAIDISVFDQYACSSPHTVFIQESKGIKAVDFAKELAKQLDLINRTFLPKGTITSSKSSEILQLRAEHELKGRVFNSDGTEWTVIYSEEKGLFEGCFSRVIMVKPIKDLLKISKFIDRQKQTLGVALTTKNKLNILDKITVKGIDRCPNLGLMTFYESPWDGMFVFDRLVRWVTIHKNK